MRYTLRNMRPSVVQIPDAGLRLDAGQTVTVEMLSPQTEDLLAQRALEVITSEADPQVMPVIVERNTRKSATPAPESPDDAH